MKITIQRSLNSKVSVDDIIVAEITKGAVLFICLEKNDNEETIEKALYKIGNLRMFTDLTTGKMSRNISDTSGEFLAVSQFTLSWDGSGGHRPGFEKSMEPNMARTFFELFCKKLETFAPVKTGSFASHMIVDIKNDGPVTFSLSF